MIKIIVYTEYNPSEVLQLEQIENSVLIDNEVIIKIFAATVTAADNL